MLMLRSCAACRALFAVLLVALSSSIAARAEDFSWSLRKRVETEPGSGRFHVLEEQQSWPARETAFIVCDMWDLHHGLNATRRGRELCPTMNRVLNEARVRGAVIIHAPSSCMESYQDHPARERALRTPRAKSLPRNITQWCDQIPAEEQGVYPIDQTDAEDDDPEEHRQWAAQLQAMGRNPRAPWKSQTPLLGIAESDYITDDGAEVWSILEHRGVQRVVLLGVHANMCVLGRPFGLRQMARNGKQVVLMRDMTDTMYNPAKAPNVSHFRGTDLIVEHIEKWVCPTVSSNQLLGGDAFRFAADKRPTLVMLVAEREYRTDESLAKFARTLRGFRIRFVFADPKQRNTLPGVQTVKDADVLLISVRRRVLPPEQMRYIREHIRQGKPVVGIRTANHAFVLRDEKPAALQDWPNWDAEIFGGSYSGHHGAGPEVRLTIAKGADSHPILNGVDVAKLVGRGSLYRVRPLAASTQALLTGSIPDKPDEPIAWTHTNRYGGRVFYTSLGHVDDFAQLEFRRLLDNALHWAAGLGTTATPADLP